jgi:hypothetical protein
MELDLLNADLLTDYEGYSNANGRPSDQEIALWESGGKTSKTTTNTPKTTGGGGQAAAEAAGVAAQLIAGLIAGRGTNEQKQELKAACGRKPFLSARNKAVYYKCINDYYRQKREAELAASMPPPEDKRGRNPLVVGGIVVGVAVLGVLTFMVIRKIRK